jgi:DNA-binding GntR family transcriptional regulator
MESPTGTLELLRAFTVPGLVQEEILRRIKTGEVEAGAKLNEVDLAGYLQISRSPVREAFRALEEAGLVRLEKNRGAFIRHLADGEANELYQIRSMIDEASGRMLAPAITLPQLQELSAALDELEGSDPAAAFTRNLAFHDRLVEMAGNATMLAMYRQTVNRMHLLRPRGFFLTGSSEASHAEHRQILRALATRDPAAAASALRDHVWSGYHRTVGAKPPEA